MKATLATLAALIATPAFADPGHFAEERGHTHWIAAAALVLAAAITLFALWKRRKTRLAAKRSAERKA